MIMNTQTNYLQEEKKNLASPLNINDFGQYLTYTSFQDVVHQVKKISLERIIANEPIPEYHVQATARVFAKTA